MFFDSLDEVVEFSKKMGATVFAVSPDVEIRVERKPKKAVKTTEKIYFPGAILISPEDGKKITIEQIREVIELSQVKQQGDRFFVFERAELIREEAENAMLKLLEEPKENYHFVLLTAEPEKLLPTIRSRVAIFYRRKEEVATELSKMKPETLAMAKRLIAARRAGDYFSIADEIHKKKDEREYASEIIAATIEVAYKSFLITGQRNFLYKIPKLVKAYENIRNNGNVRLHLIADLC